LAIRLLRVAGQRRNYQLGFSGERLVGEQLNALMLHGCRIFHDFPARGIGNIDHIVLAHGSVFAIETKTRRKGKARPGRKDHEVIYDGRRLNFPDWDDTGMLRQAQDSAEWLSEFLTRATAEPVAVHPVLVLPGWMVTRKVKKGVAVLNQKEIRSYILAQSDSLAPAAKPRILEVIEKQCRDVQF
jgi:hypothetical protein